jgi:hypothetical protein
MDLARRHEFFIEVSPTNTTSSDQQVNQAASAFGS